MTSRYRYPIDLHQEREGGYSATFPDFFEAFTDGNTFAEAIAEAADCLEEALAGRIVRQEPDSDTQCGQRPSHSRPGRNSGRQGRLL